MLFYVLRASATLNNVKGVEPLDNQDYPHDYKFVVRCSACRHQRDKPIDINQQDEVEVTGFRRSANFFYRCRECKRERYASVKRTKNAIEGEDLVDLVEIETVGIELLEFIPDDQYHCTSILSNEEVAEIDLSEGEWYGYDDEGKGEVSISNVKWSLDFVR